MATVKLNFSLDADVAQTLRRRAAMRGESMSRYLAELVREEELRSLDEAAEEGYRLLSRDTGDFAAAALEPALETWSSWEPVPQSTRRASRRGKTAAR